MKSFIWILFLLAASISLEPSAVLGSEKAGVQWIDQAEAVELSKKSGKPLLYFIMASWNLPSKQMAAEVFGNTEIAQWINQNFLALHIKDELREKGINSIRTRALYKKYQIDDFPTLVVEMPVKRFYHKWKKELGFRNPALTRQFLENALLELKESK